jgi:hypothetical protein
MNHKFPFLARYITTCYVQSLGIHAYTFSLCNYYISTGCCQMLCRKSMFMKVHVVHRKTALCYICLAIFRVYIYCLHGIVNIMYYFVFCYFYLWIICLPACHPHAREIYTWRRVPLCKNLPDHKYTHENIYLTISSKNMKISTWQLVQTLKYQLNNCACQVFYWLPLVKQIIKYQYTINQTAQHSEYWIRLL